MSAGDGQQDDGAAGDGTGVSAVSESTEAAAESPAAAAHAARPVRHEHELHGGCGGTVHGCTQGESVYSRIWFII